MKTKHRMFVYYIATFEIDNNGEKIQYKSIEWSERKYNIGSKYIVRYNEKLGILYDILGKQNGIREKYIDVSLSIISVLLAILHLINAILLCYAISCL